MRHVEAPRPQAKQLLSESLIIAHAKLIQQINAQFSDKFLLGDHQIIAV